MIVKNITRDQLEQALQKASAVFDGNLMWNRAPEALNGKGTRFACTIRCRPRIDYVKCTVAEAAMCTATGARIKHKDGRWHRVKSPFYNAPGRKRSMWKDGFTSAACYHAHYAFIREVMEFAGGGNGVITIRTAMATFTPTNWREVADTLANKNVGSMMYPRRFADACDCDFDLTVKACQRGVESTVMRQSDLLKCPFIILEPSHYRKDGSCKCDDPIHRQFMIANWDYSEKDFASIPLRS